MDITHFDNNNSIYKHPCKKWHPTQKGTNESKFADSAFQMLVANFRQFYLRLYRNYQLEDKIKIYASYLDKHIFRISNTKIQQE